MNLTAPTLGILPRGDFIVNMIYCKHIFSNNFLLGDLIKKTLIREKKCPLNAMFGLESGFEGVDLR